MKAELRRTPILRGKRVLVVARSDRGPEVLDFSPQVERVSPGMPLREAMSRCEGAALVEADESCYDRLFDRIVEALLDRSPLVEKGGLGCAFVDMRGTGELYGGDEGMVDAVLGAVPRGFGPRVGLAESKFPAYAAAIGSRPGHATKVPGDAAAFLADMPVGLLPVSWKSGRGCTGSVSVPWARSRRLGPGPCRPSSAHGAGCSGSWPTGSTTVPSSLSGGTRR